MSRRKNSRALLAFVLVGVRLSFRGAAGAWQRPAEIVNLLVVDQFTLANLTFLTFVGYTVRVKQISRRPGGYSDSVRRMKSARSETVTLGKIMTS